MDLDKYNNILIENCITLSFNDYIDDIKDIEVNINNDDARKLFNTFTVDYSYTQNDMFELKLIKCNDIDEVNKLVSDCNLKLNCDYKTKQKKTKNSDIIVEYMFNINGIKKAKIVKDIGYYNFVCCYFRCVNAYNIYQERLFKKLSLVKDFKLDMLLKDCSDKDIKLESMTKKIDSVIENNNRMIDIMNIQHLNTFEEDPNEIQYIYSIYKLKNGKFLIIDCPKSAFHTVYKNFKSYYEQTLFNEIIQKEYKHNIVNLSNSLLKPLRTNISVLGNSLIYLNPGYTDDEFIVHLKQNIKLH